MNNDNKKIKLIEQVDSLREKGISWIEISKKLNISTTTLSNMKELKKHKASKTTQEQKNQIILLRQSGKSYKEISNIVGCSIKVVGHTCDRSKIKIEKFNSAQKLNKENFNEISKLDSEGIHYKEISKIFNVDESTIRWHLRKLKNIKQGMNSSEIFKKNIQIIQKLLIENKTKEKIIEITKLHPETIRKHIKFIQNEAVSKSTIILSPTAKAVDIANVPAADEVSVKFKDIHELTVDPENVG